MNKRIQKVLECKPYLSILPQKGGTETKQVVYGQVLGQHDHQKTVNAD